ncbi:protein NATD1 isoform X1 [Sardina pilchardus]|uniref:protein NATD1 isoform X1 n=1 Tax=Sardina pilchardus TaxID=27697 RepID=UPI002E0DD0FC
MAQAAQMNVNEISTPLRVEHDKKRRQFTIRLNGSHDRAVLLYEYVGKKTVDLQHTEVPDAFRGRGSNGLCGGGRLEGPPYLLVHPEVCEREPPPSIPGAHHPLKQAQRKGVGGEGAGVEVGVSVGAPCPSQLSGNGVGWDMQARG